MLKLPWLDNVCAAVAPVIPPPIMAMLNLREISLLELSPDAAFKEVVEDAIERDMIRF